jgi:hypothetical protein
MKAVAQQWRLLANQLETIEGKAENETTIALGRAFQTATDYHRRVPTEP